MYNQTTARSPFLDHRVVEFAVGLPRGAGSSADGRSSGSSARSRAGGFRPRWRRSRRPGSRRRSASGCAGRSGDRVENVLRVAVLRGARRLRPARRPRGARAPPLRSRRLRPHALDDGDDRALVPLASWTRSASPTSGSGSEPAALGGRPPRRRDAAELREDRRPSPARSTRARSAFDAVLVHTGQHYDDAMSRVFFEQLGIGEPDRVLGRRLRLARRADRPRRSSGSSRCCSRRSPISCSSPAT